MGSRAPDGAWIAAGETFTKVLNVPALSDLQRRAPLVSPGDVVLLDADRS